MPIRKGERRSQMIEKVAAGDGFGAQGFPALGGSAIATDDGEVSAGLLRVWRERWGEERAVNPTQQPLNFSAMHCCVSRLASVICSGVMRPATSFRFSSACFCSSPFMCTAARLTHKYART
jgi:hypothetical protein